MIRSLCLVSFLICAAHGADAPKLPADADTLVTHEGMDEFRLKADFDAKVYKLRGELIAKLTKAQEAATKKGDLDGALAIKARIVDLNKDLPEKETTPVTAQDLKKRLSGLSDYTFQSGRKGQLDIRGSGATDVLSNVQGTVTITKDVMTIEWGNGTQWKFSAKDDAITAQAPDGTATITKH